MYRLLMRAVFFLRVITEGFKEFKGSGSIDKDWDADFADRSSKKYRDLSRDLKNHLTAVLKNSAYEEDFLGVDVYNFRSGSTKFDFTVYLKATTTVNEETLKVVIQAGKGSSNFNITGVSVEQVAGPKPTTSTTESGLEKWIIVLIATGSVIIILGIALTIIVVSRKPFGHYTLKKDKPLFFLSILAVLNPL